MLRPSDAVAAVAAEGALCGIVRAPSMLIDAAGCASDHKTASTHEKGSSSTERSELTLMNPDRTLYYTTTTTIIIYSTPLCIPFPSCSKSANAVWSVRVVSLLVLILFIRIQWSAYVQAFGISLKRYTVEFIDGITLLIYHFPSNRLVFFFDVLESQRIMDSIGCIVYTTSTYPIILSPITNPSPPNVSNPPTKNTTVPDLYSL